jgi:hypothetical protein
MGDDSHIVFGQNSLVIKETEMVCCHDSTATSFVNIVQGEVFAYFHAVIVKCHCSSGVDCLACQYEFFVNNHCDVKENDENALEFTLHLSCYFSV